MNASTSATARRWPLVAIAVIGVGLALAPAAFRMFERAPKGGDMIDGFGPYMDQAEIDQFRGHLSTIGAARSEAGPVLTDESRARVPAVAAFDAEWPAIDADMRSMLDDMERNIDAYEGVAALPPFALFPWFFVAPGVLLALGSVWALRSSGRLALLGAVAVGLLLAPVAFQMFSRAPAGADMIDDFRPFMRPEKVTQIQGYFLTIGAAEGQLRQTLLPELAELAAGAGVPVLPAVDAFVSGWQRMSADMAPMIGAMADNVDNFAAVAALPPFGLFPWFFVAPGVLVLALVATGRPRRSFDVISRTRMPLVALALLTVVAGCGGDDGDGDAAGGTELVGLLAIAPGTCDGAAVTGSWFRMVQPGGTVDAGPFVANADSPCPDQDVSPLAPGTDGGLRAGSYQPQPDPPFAADGTSASSAVIVPQSFFAVRFGISTNEEDPQSGEQVPAPTVLLADDGTLDADLRSVSVSWNGQHFNQGAPKPGTDSPRATGTYDEATHAYALDWTSTVDGGPFDGFTGVWHLQGRFQPTEGTP